jgi:hypothetical protein
MLCALQVAITSCDSYGLDDVAQHTPAAAATAATASAPAAVRTADTKLAPVSAGQQSSSQIGLHGFAASRGGHTVDDAASKAVSTAAQQQQGIASPRRQNAATLGILPPVSTAAGTATAAAVLSSFDQHVFLGSPPSHHEHQLLPGDKHSQPQLRLSDPLDGGHEVVQQQRQQQQFSKPLQQQQQQQQQQQSLGEGQVLPVQALPMNDSDEELMDLILEERLVL